MAVAQLRQAIAAFGPILMQIYGMTESGLGTILHPHQHVLDGPPEWVRRLGSAGQEALGYRVSRGAAGRFGLRAGGAGRDLG